MKLFSSFIVDTLANPLKQGISRNHKHGRKSRLTLKFTPRAERESKASHHSERIRSLPLDRMNEKREGEKQGQWNESMGALESNGSIGKQSNGYRIHSLNQGKTLMREAITLHDAYYFNHARAHNLLWSIGLRKGITLERILSKHQNPSSFFFIGNLLTYAHMVSKRTLNA